MRNPPTTRMRDVHMLHHTQSVLMIDENSALRGNMPQRNDEEGGKTPRLSFSPASSVWGQMGRPWTTIGRGETHTTEKITEADYVAFFHQFFGFTNNPALAPFANVQCPCQRWVVTVPGTISTPAPTIVQIGPSRMSMSCGRWSASVMTPVMPLTASGCSRVRAPAAPI
jgi:hypothetical protein